MKAFLLMIGICWCQTVFAQQKIAGADETGIRSTELGEVTVKSMEPDRFKNKIRPMNAFIRLEPTQPGITHTKWDSIFFMTRFPQPEPDSIFLHAVEVKLNPYDTAMFDIKLLIYQIRERDTLSRILPIAGGRIDKKGRLKIALTEAQIILQPGDFYIGYGFHPKSIPAPFQYRMYATNRGEGAILDFRPDKVAITSGPHFPYVFPFQLYYRKY